MKKIVVVGGGSGIFNVLKGLKNYPVSITSIVTSFDNGGSTGRLRDELGILPPGDIRRSLVALAPDTGDSTLRDLFSFRFAETSSLQGHSFGNLFIHALTTISGGEIAGIKKAAEILGINHTILPVSLDIANLSATLVDGSIIEGETNIDIPKHDGSLAITDLRLEPKATLLDEARQAILEADLVIIGPGDLYTSLLPHTLVDGFTEAIRESPASVAYIVNTMTKWGETDGFTTTDFVRTLLAYLKRDRIDYLICNGAPLEPHLIEKYKKARANPVATTLSELEPYTDNIIIEDVVTQTDVIRHDADKISKVIMNIIQ